MSLRIGKKTNPGAVPLHSAALCMDCESVTNNRFDKCPVCGSSSVLSMARMLGGTLLAKDVSDSEKRGNLVRFDLEITIGVQRMEAGELNIIVDGIASLISPKLARGRARLHINVQPVVEGAEISEMKAA